MSPFPPLSAVHTPFYKNSSVLYKLTRSTVQMSRVNFEHWGDAFLGAKKSYITRSNCSTVNSVALIPECRKQESPPLYAYLLIMFSWYCFKTLSRSPLRNRRIAFPACCRIA